MNQTPTRRQVIIELLQLIASEEQQLAYERNVPHVDITIEMVCMWFDDQYHTGRGFDQFFTSDEFAALEEFHCFYDARVAHLPESQGTVRTWLASPIWCEVMEQARRTLERVAT